MKRKKGILLAAVVETFVLAILLLLFFTGSISLNLFIALAVLAGILSSAAMFVIFRNTEP
jgi:hypothetical protein